MLVGEEWCSRRAMDHLLFGGWTGLLRAVIVGLLADAGLVALLRVCGKPTLSKMDASQRYCPPGGTGARGGRGPDRPRG